jgi:hypothetical protein
MKARTQIAALLLAIALFACSSPQTAPAANDVNQDTKSSPTATIAPMPKVDYQTIAAKLAEQCAGVKEGDIVQIFGGVKYAELLEDIAVEVRKRGAFPLLTFGGDRLNRKMFDEVPDKFVAQVNQWASISRKWSPRVLRCPAPKILHFLPMSPPKDLPSVRMQVPKPRKFSRKRIASALYPT